MGNHSHLLLVRKTLIPFSKAICKRHQEPLKSFYFLQGSSVYPLLLLHQLIHLKTKSIIYLLMAPKRDICACFGLPAIRNRVGGWGHRHTRLATQRSARPPPRPPSSPHPCDMLFMLCFPFEILTAAGGVKIFGDKKLWDSLQNV